MIRIGFPCSGYIRPVRCNVSLAVSLIRQRTEQNLLGVLFALPHNGHRRRRSVTYLNRDDRSWLFKFVIR